MRSLKDISQQKMKEFQLNFEIWKFQISIKFLMNETKIARFKTISNAMKLT